MKLRQLLAVLLLSLTFCAYVHAQGATLHGTVIVSSGLAVSEATVKAHVSAILQKLRVESRTQAVILASKIELNQWPQTAPLDG